MDLEPTLAVAEAPMTIDYDQPQGELIPGDAEMGLAAPVVTSVEPSHPELGGAPAEAIDAEEAEMQDDRAIDDVVEGVTTRESEIIMVEEDDAVDVPFSNAEEQPAAAIIDAQDVEPVITPSVAANELADSSSEAATLAPEPTLSSREDVVAEGGLTATEMPAGAAATATGDDGDDTVIETIETTTVETLVTSVEDGVPAAPERELEQPEASVVDDAPATGQNPTDDKDAIEHAVIVEQSAEGAKTTEDAKVGQTAESVLPLFAIATEKLSEQIPKSQAATDAATADAQNARPPVDKDPLLQVQLPADLFPAPEASTSTARLAPGVLLTCGGTTYSLFRQLQVANEPSFHEEDEEEDQEGDEPRSGEVDAPLILAAMAQHALYYESVDKLVQALRELLPELNGEADELVLDFEDLGITVGEDNVYSRQVSLFDFDRLQLGCQIPNRLHARIYAQPRFASGFNALAQHIASTYSSAPSLEEEEAASQAGEGEGEDLEEEVEGGEEEEEEGAGAADDYDGPDSELPIMSASGEEGEEEEEGGMAGEGVEAAKGGGDDDDEFDLESALAQLDQDNIVAVVEGAQEDLLLESSERAAVDEEEGEEQPVNREDEREAAAGAAAEGHEDGAAGGGEEPQGEGKDGQSSEVVETAEAVESTTTTTMARSEEVLVGETLAEDEGAAAELDDGAKEVEQSVIVPPAQADASRTSEHDEVSQEAIVDEPESARPAESAQAADTVTVEANGAAVVDDIVPVTGEQAEAPEGDAAPDPSDVVIDYDEAFDPSSAMSADGATENTATVTNGVTEAEGPPPSPKRSRSFDAVEGREEADEDLAADAKRPRLGESETDGPAEAATA